MTLKESYIILRNLRYHAFHGVMPQERIVGGEYTVSLRIGYDAGKAMVSDDVADTVDYSALCRIVDAVMKEPCSLLENVAYKIGGRICGGFPSVTAVDVSVTKLNPPMSADSDGATVELHLINDKTAGRVAVL